PTRRPPRRRPPPHPSPNSFTNRVLKNSLRFVFPPPPLGGLHRFCRLGHLILRWSRGYRMFAASSASGERSPFSRGTRPAMSSPLHRSTIVVSPLLEAST